jgi:hypothetical protein
MAFDRIREVIPMGRGSVPTTVGVFHTVPSGTRDILKDIDISNNAQAPAEVTVYLVPSGDSPGAANILVPAVTIKGKRIFQWTGSQNLDTGDTIQAVSNILNVSINMSGGRLY